MLQQLLEAQGDPLIAVDGADFDGANDYLTNTTYNEASDSGIGVISFWYRCDGGDGTLRSIFHMIGAVNDHIFLQHTAGNLISMTGLNSSGATVLSKTSSSTILAGSGWKHILIAWDLSVPQFQMYINDASDVAGGGTLTAGGSINLQGDWAVGALLSGAQKLNGCLAEFYCKFASALDLSVLTNRRKFSVGGRKPISLGADGSTPQGGTPFYLHLAKGSAAANFATNQGTGGAFTVTGALTTASNSPSD